MIKFNGAEAGTIVLVVNNSLNTQHNIKTSFLVWLFFFKKTNTCFYFQAFVCLSLKYVQAQLPILLQKNSLPSAGERRLYLNRALKQPQQTEPRTTKKPQRAPKRTRKKLNIKSQTLAKYRNRNIATHLYRK